MSQIKIIEEDAANYISPYNLPVGGYGVTRSGHVWFRTIDSVVNLTVPGTTGGGFGDHPFVRVLRPGTKVEITVGK